MKDPEFVRYFEMSREYAEIWESLRKVEKKKMVKAEREVPKQDGRFKGKGEWVFLTVNPKPDIKYEDFFSTVHSYHKTAGISCCTYTFEQRDVDGDVFKGLHMHSIFKRTIKPYRIEKNIHSYFDKFTPTGICIKYVNETEVEKIENYIKGNKEASKMPKAIHDKKMREKYHHAPFYTC